MENFVDKKTALLLSFLIIILGISYAFIDRKEVLEDGLRLVSPATFVEEFGEQLKFVPLTGEREIVAAGMRDYYRGYVSEELLSRWIDDPTSAPGRLTSSPYPERMEVESVKERPDSLYEIMGVVVETTNDSSGSKILRPFILELSVSRNGYLITDFRFGQ